jgi:hypothetical protein
VANKFTYDTAAKLFILNAGVTSLDAKTEFYSWVKTDWKNNDALNKFAFPIESIGGNNIGGGVSISPYYSLKNGWKIRPAEEHSSITVIGNIITDDSSDPFVGTVGTWDTVIKYVVSGNSLQSGGGGSLTAAQVWQYVLEDSVSAAEAFRLVLAAETAKTTLAGNTFTIRDIADTKDRIVGTVDKKGSRTAVATRDGT